MGRIFILLLVLSSVSAAADPVSSTPKISSANSLSNPSDPIVCRREAVTGSLAGARKICMKKTAWAMQRRDAQDAGNHLQEGGLIRSCGATTPGAC